MNGAIRFSHSKSNTHSLTHSLTQRLTHSLTHSLSSVTSNPVTQSVIPLHYPALTHSLTHSLTDLSEWVIAVRGVCVRWCSQSVGRSVGRWFGGCCFCNLSPFGVFGRSVCVAGCGLRVVGLLGRQLFVGCVGCCGLGCGSLVVGCVGCLFEVVGCVGCCGRLWQLPDFLTSLWVLATYY